MHCRAFGERTGVPVLVNTSFNVRGEPIVVHARNAIEAFFSTPLDALVIGSFIVEKNAMIPVRARLGRRQRPAAARPRLGAARDGIEALRLSVVIPTFRRPDLLRRCLEAVLAQTLDPHAFEVIVVDDGHTDDTPGRRRRVQGARRSASSRYLRPRHGRGPAVARNAGWRAALCEASIAFTDDDTVPTPDWLAAGRARAGAGLVALCGRVAVPRAPRDGGADAADRPRADDARPRDAPSSSPPTPSCGAVRCERVGGFDERFQRAWREDSDLQFRLLREAGPVGRCDGRGGRCTRCGRSAGACACASRSNAYFDALLYKKHPQLYRERIRRAPPWDYYAIVALTLAAPALLGRRRRGSAAVSLLLALAGVLRLAAKRLRRTALTPAHVVEMIATSAVIPFLSVYWRLRGALHFRVLFL